MERQIISIQSNEAKGKKKYEKHTRYPLSTIISNMMFANGDSNEPLKECQDFLLEFIQSQLKMLIERVLKLTQECGRHPTLFKRLVLYIQMLEMPMEMTSALPFCESNESPPSGSKETEDEDSSHVIEAIPEQKTRINKSLLAALRGIDVLGNLLAGTGIPSCNDPDNKKDWVDTTKLERLHRISLRTKEMDAIEYEKFAEARQISFCSNKGQKSANFCKYFVEWLGSPPLEAGVVRLINFCASEIVTILVESASLCRDQERKPDICEPLTNSLFLRHYHEAVRRNQGYAKRKDILFGSF